MSKIVKEPEPQWLIDAKTERFEEFKKIATTLELELKSYLFGPANKAGGGVTEEYETRKKWFPGFLKKYIDSKENKMNAATTLYDAIKKLTDEEMTKPSNPLNDEFEKKLKAILADDKITQKVVLNDPPGSRTDRILSSAITQITNAESEFNRKSGKQNSMERDFNR